MLKKIYLELIIFIITFLSFFVTGIAIQENERFFSLYDYTPLNTGYVVDYNYDDYLILADEINSQTNKTISTVYYAIEIDHVSGVYNVFYNNDEIFMFGVPLIGLEAFGKVSEEMIVTLPKAVSYDDNPIVRRYLNYSYQFTEIDSNIPAESHTYIVFDISEISLDQISSIARNLEVESIFRNPVNLSEVVRGFKASVEFFYVTFQSLSIIPITFGFIIAFMFYKMNSFEYTNDMLIKRINGISKSRLFIQNTLVFIMKLILPIIMGVSIASIIFSLFGISIISANGIIVFLILFTFLLFITALMETRKVFKMSLTRLVT